MEEKKSSKTKVIIIVIVLLLLIALAVFLILRTSQSEVEKTASIATIWLASKSGRDDGSLNWDNVYEFISRERRGFLRGMSDANFSVVINETLLSENDAAPDITSALAETVNSDDILMAVGASEDLPTMYAAMETDFFGIPMLIPFSDGDIISDRSAGYTMRMTLNSNSFTDFIGNQLLPSSVPDWLNTTVFAGKPIPDDSVNTSIFFADNFNGHDMAVLITQRLMDNGFDIDHYGPYQQNELYTAFTNAWEDEGDTIGDSDVVIIIGYDQDPMYELSNAVDLWKTRRGPEDQPLFLLLGYVPTTLDPEIFEKDNVYVIRQKLDRSECPAEIVNNDEAIAYAAGWITSTAIERAAEKQQPEPLGWKLWFKTGDQKRQSHQDYLESYRNNIRSVLMEMNEYVPCYGTISFTSKLSDQAAVELVHYTSDRQAEVLDSSRVFSYIYDMYRSRYGLIGE